MGEAGDPDTPFTTPAAIAEIETIRAATIDRYLTPPRCRMQLRGISATTGTVLSTDAPIVGSDAPIVVKRRFVLVGGC